MTIFEVNIFGTDHVNLDGGGTTGFYREFILNIMQVTCNVPITNFDMFIEYYAYQWGFLTPVRVTIPNGVDGRITNGRPNVIHLDTMTPTVAPSLQFDCQANPNGGGSCPTPSDIRLYSVAHGVPIDLGSGTGYDVTETDMYNQDSVVAKLPVNIIIIADECRYNSVGAEVNIYRDYFSSPALYGGNSDINPIGFDEKIIIS